MALSWPTISSNVSGLKRDITFLFIFLASNASSFSSLLLVFEFSMPFCFFIIDNFNSSINLSCLSAKALSTSTSILFWTYFLAIFSDIQYTTSSKTSTASLSFGTTLAPFPSDAITFSAYILSFMSVELIYFCNLNLTVLALIAPSSRTFFNISKL